MAIDEIGLRQIGNDRMGQTGHQHALIGMAQHHAEFVAPQPSAKGIGRHQHAQTLGHLTEQLVAHRMAQRVIDLLEPVQIEAMDRDRPMIAARHGQNLAQPVEHHRPVGQAGQRVVKGQMARAGLAGDQVAGDGVAAAAWRADQSPSPGTGPSRAIRSAPPPAPAAPIPPLQTWPQHDSPKPPARRDDAPGPPSTTASRAPTPPASRPASTSTQDQGPSASAAAAAA
ncbi:hypothetical protein E4T56_gene1811 [Termitomyces sp. T112]|nr:hypothetical protein E4T56_gene1811 [Termitomyces sp. T112]